MDLVVEIKDLGRPEMRINTINRLLLEELRMTRFENILFYNQQKYNMVEDNNVGSGFILIDKELAEKIGLDTTQRIFIQ